LVCKRNVDSFFDVFVQIEVHDDDIATLNSRIDELEARLDECSCNGDTTCFGILDTDPEVCNSHGICIDQDTCLCEAGWIGEQCSILDCTPSPEVCDGQDNDCDSQVDEEGVCGTCIWSPEVCNGLDDNCDGLIDEDWPELGATCDGSDSDVCLDGIFTCTIDGSGTECNDDSAGMIELCNGLDDDCDGAIDEDWPELGVSCDGSDSDVCMDGVFICTSYGSGTECNDDSAGIIEICNGIDDDCDGIPDEGCDDCNDDNECTDDIYDTQSYTCIYSPSPALPCNDGDACTAQDMCDTQGSCSGTLINCDDDNPCTMDSCNPSFGCVSSPSPALPCNDGNECTQQDMCDSQGSCSGTLIPGCN